MLALADSPRSQLSWELKSQQSQVASAAGGLVRKQVQHESLDIFSCFFPTCQLRVVRFYVNSRSSSSAASSASSPDLNYDDHSRVFAAGPQPRPATPSVRCRTSTTTSHAQCSLPDLNHDQPRPVFAAGPQPQPPTPSVRFQTSTTTIHAQCSLPDLNRQKICQIECQKI